MVKIELNGDMENENKEEKTDEEVYQEAFDHFDGNHSKTIPTSVSFKLKPISHDPT